MSVVKLCIFGMSAPCRSVYMTAKALDMPLELKYVDYHKKEHLQPAFAKMNPEHTVPVIQDGDYTLWESRAIMRYLVGKFGGEDNSLYPRDLQKRGIIDRLLDHDLGFFYKTMLDDIFAPAKQRQEPTQKQESKITKAFKWLDNEVKDKKYLTGDNLTIADFATVVGFAASVVRTDMDKYPHAMAWYQRMKDLPYYMEVNKPYYDIIPLLKGEKSTKS